MLNFTPASVRRFIAGVFLTFVALFASVAVAQADTIFALVNSADVYEVDSATGTITNSYVGLFTGTTAQNLAEDLNGNLYVSNASGQLVTATPPYSSATTGAAIAAPAQTDPQGAWTNPALSITASIPRLAYDTRTSRLVTTMTGACPTGSGQSGTCTFMLAFTPANPGGATSLLLGSNVGNGGGDVVAYQDAIGHTTWYMVAQKNFYIIDGTTGAVQGPFAMSGTGLTGSLTGITQTADGALFACEQVASGTPWRLWRFTTAAAAQTMTLVNTFSTGNDVVNDLAILPVFFTVTKSGTGAGGPGDSVRYVVTVKNNGFATLGTVMARDIVPATITISTGANAPTCTVTGGSGSCATPAVAGQTVTAQATGLGIGASVLMTINGTPNATSGSASNTGCGSVPYDPNNNMGSNNVCSTPVTTTLTASSLTKTVQNITAGGTVGTTGTGAPGDVLEYVVTYTNNRGVTLKAATFTISDTVPANTTFVAGSAACVSQPAGTTCTAPTTGPALSWTFGGTDIAPNGVLKIKFRARLN